MRKKLKLEEFNEFYVDEFTFVLEEKKDLYIELVQHIFLLIKLNDPCEHKKALNLCQEKVC